MSTARQFKSLTPIEPTDDDIAAFAQRRGVPAIQAVMPAGVEAPKSEPDLAPSTRLALDVPIYLSDQLKRRALDERCSTRFIILKAIRAAGFDINDTDLIADGRRIRR